MGIRVPVGGSLMHAGGMDAAGVAAEHIVAMMGAEPHIAALERGADVVLAGRSSDSALFAAYPLWKGAPPAPAWHMSKTIECGALCAERPAGARTSIWAEVDGG